MSVVWEGITPGFYHQYSYEIAEYYVYWICLEILYAYLSSVLLKWSFYKSIDDAPDELKDCFLPIMWLNSWAYYEC